jgi:hypothetical protein
MDAPTPRTARAPAGRPVSPTDGAGKVLVEKVAPAFVGHLEMAKNLRTRLGK